MILTILKRAACSLSVVFLPAVLLAAEEGGQPNIMGLPFATFWAALSFLIVLLILWKKLLPPIFTALDKRAQDIRDSLDAAEKARADAGEMIKRHEDALEKARQEARAIIEEGKADAERVKDKIVSDARADAEDVTARARREIDLAKQAALHELHQQSVALSLDLAGSLIKKTLNADDHQDLIQDRIKSFQTGDN